MSSQEIINIGTLPNDGSGDPLRVAFGKINNNFSNLFSTSTFNSNSYTVGNSSNQVIFETFANTFTQAQFYIRSSDTSTNDSQTIQLYAQINNSNNEVKFTGYGTTFFGNALATFDMDVVSGNVRVLCSPLISSEIFHFVSSQLLYQGQDLPGIPLSLDGFVDAVVSTENDLTVTTE
jgi:hypothetical protein